MSDLFEVEMLEIKPLSFPRGFIFRIIDLYTSTPFNQIHPLDIEKNTDEYRWCNPPVFKPESK